MPDDIWLRFSNYQGLLNALHGEIKLFREWKLPIDSDDPKVLRTLIRNSDAK